MPEVPYHGWTHRPKAQGGTDPIEFPGGQMPFAYTWFKAASLADVTDYSLGVDDGEFEPASFGSTAGIADFTEIWNDDAGDTFRRSDDDTMLWLGGEPGLFAFDSGAYFGSGFTGRVDLYPLLTQGIVNTYSSPSTDVYAETRFPVSADGSFTIRCSGTVLLEPAAFADELPNGSYMITARIAQDSGASRTLTQGWMLWARLTTATAPA